jgi:hypothetical protein
MTRPSGVRAELGVLDGALYSIGAAGSGAESAGLNEALRAKVAGAKLLRTAVVRADTTAIPADVASPPDSGAAGQGGRQAGAYRLADPRDHPHAVHQGKLFRQESTQVICRATRELSAWRRKPGGPSPGLSAAALRQ